MQITLDFGTLTIPTGEPYQKRRADKQRENLAYVVLQLLDQAKQAGVKLTYTDADEPPTIGLRLDGCELAQQALVWNGQEIDLGPIKIILHNRTMSVNPVE